MEKESELSGYFLRRLEAHSDFLLPQAEVDLGKDNQE